MRERSVCFSALTAKAAWVPMRTPERTTNCRSKVSRFRTGREKHRCRRPTNPGEQCSYELIAGHQAIPKQTRAFSEANAQHLPKSHAEI
jgi:hypothetical protein